VATKHTPQSHAQLARSLTLLKVFLLASALILCAGAFALTTVLTGTVRKQALDDARVSLTQYVNGVLHDQLVQDGRVTVADADAIAQRDLRNRPDILSVKVWSPDGTLAWTNLAQERIGKHYPLTGHRGEAIAEGKAEAELESLVQSENAVESRLGVDKVVEIYAPIFGDNGKPIGAYEIYADSEQIESLVGERSRQLWLIVLAVFLLLYASLALLVRGASSRMHRQTQTLKQRSNQLLDSYRELEQSSLEAIEVLNATVEARDPYTAGHSARVQRIALAIGLELSLDSARLTALGHGALFHDVGKLAVPDAVLLKPGKLDPAEYALIKLHAEKGAEIVGYLGRLRDAVPLIRHHHERWDGRGYPDGLAGDAIPAEAAIVGLADAWDAMTTDRPYARALTLEEAHAEIRAGRGSQFSPAVVDAFLAAARRRPAEFSRVTPFGELGEIADAS
jgi:HD-GYP domain-containing protein (c-di-GMP phosphodiesterase class II)